MYVHAFQEHLPKYDRIVVFFIVSAKQQSNRAFLGQITNLIQQSHMLSQLLHVTVPEFCPTTGIVAEPFA
jgi:mannitol/fructose-specific phosphotransferase system IIA component (Ntr-type)